MRNQKDIIIFFIIFCLVLFHFSSIRQRVQAYDNPLKIEKILGLSTIPGTFRKPTAIAIAKDGSIFIADSGESQIEVYDANLKYLYSFGSIGSGNNQFQAIQQIRFDENESSVCS